MSTNQPIDAARPQSASASGRAPSLEAAAASPSTEQKSVQVFDRPMCCSTGVCGPSVDPVLPRFAADLEWLKSLGHAVERYNLAQQPQQFASRALIRELLNAEGTACLPVIVVDEQVVSRGEYPSREQLAKWVGVKSLPFLLPLATSDSCCEGGDCC